VCGLNPYVPDVIPDFVVDKIEPMPREPEPPKTPNNGEPKKTRCGLAVTEGVISVSLDVLGAIPGLGNLVSAGAAGARVVNGIVAYGGAAYGIGTGLPDESPVGAVSAGAGLGLTLADAALEGGKVIPVLGNALSLGTGVYDSIQLVKTIQRCRSGG
jgi:hypothetical protein